VSQGVKKIRFNSPLHIRIVDALRARKRLAQNHFIAPRSKKWTEAENQFLAYLPTSENDALRKSSRESGKPQYTTIEIPYSYATMMTAHTYLTTVFLSRNPIFQYTGRHGETEHQVRSVEAVMDYQNQVGEMLVPLYIWLFDSLKYGVGIVGSYWVDEFEVISNIVEREKTFLGLPMGGMQKVRITKRIRGYSGNKLFNVRPFDFYPDPRVALANFQRGEFAGRDVDVGWNDIVKGQQAGKYFNVDVLERMRVRSETTNKDTGSMQMNIPEVEMILHQANINDMGYVHLHEMIVELVPKEWGLGNQTWPEKWAFTVANDKVLINAQPLGFYHNKFPFFPIEPELNGYTQVNRGMLEVIKPLNDVMTWLINSHFYNVRKAMNDQFIVDPSMIEMADLIDPNPGKLLRLKPAAYGRDVRSAIKQLDVVDITRGHLVDSQIVAEMIQRVTGVTENIMGMVNPGGRKTATEVRSSSTFGINRLKSTAEYLSAQGFSRLSQVLIQATQQNYDIEQTFKIAGKLAFEAKPWTQVSPDSIQGFFNFIPVDGTMPVDKFALVNTWRELMVQASKMPQVMQQFDFAKIFAYVAELAGAKNISQFRIELQPDEVLQDQAARGNTIPLRGDNNGRTVVQDEEGAARPPQPTQITGMGATG